MESKFLKISYKTGNDTESIGYIIKEFMDTFSNTYNIANDNGNSRTQNNIKMPEICNNLETTRMSLVEVWSEPDSYPMMSSGVEGPPFL